MPAFLNSSLGNAASAIDRAIAEGPMALEPATVPVRATAPSSTNASFGRAPSGGGFGKKR